MKRTPTSPLLQEKHHVKKAKVTGSPKTPSPTKSVFANGNVEFAESLTTSTSQDNDTDRPWTKVEKRKAKKAMKKAEVKLDSTAPKFMYCNSEIVKRHRAIGIDEIRDLVLHILADAPPPNWLKVENASEIPTVLTLLIPGLTREIRSLPPVPTSATSNPNLPIPIPLPARNTGPGSSAPGVPFIASTFSHACPTRAPGDQTRMHSVFGTFFSGPVTGAEKKRQMELKVASSRNHAKSDPAQYLLTLEQMIENEYPIPSYMADVYEKPDGGLGWVETPEEVKPSLLETLSLPKRQVYAIDCEMCMTEDGKELARVCIIDFHSGVRVYDQLVKPAKPVLDYLTRWSGITAADLAPVTTTLEEAQAHILRLLSPPQPNPFSTSSSSDNPRPTPILVGHSLESDLKALKICHPYCIDTALIFHHPRGRPLKPGLAWLTKKWCGREIQAQLGGHNPEEDARACIELLQKKLKYGSEFGEFKIDFESIFERMGRSHRRAGGGPGSIKCAVVDHGNPSVMHGNKATTSIGCADDDEVCQKLVEVLPSHHFVFGRFVGLADGLGWLTPKDAPPTEPSPPPSPEKLASLLSSLNTHLKTLHAALPPRSALVIFTGHGDPRKMASLAARKVAFETAIKSGKLSTNLDPSETWTMQHVRELEDSVEMAKRGLLFLGVKTG